jgi:hypothetical protein
MLAAVDRLLYARWFVRASAVVTIVGIVGTIHTVLGLFGHTPGLTELGFIFVVLGLVAFVAAVAVRRRVLHAAEICRGKVETNRHMMVHATNEGLYWPAPLVGLDLVTDSAPLLDKPAVYRALQDAIVRFQTWTDRSATHLGGTVPPDQLERLEEDISTVQNAVDALDRLIGQLVALPALLPKRR